MAMNQMLLDDLKQEVQTDFQRQILQDCKRLMAISRSKITDYYEQWDAADEAYRAHIDMDKSDRDASDKKEPVRMCVPLSYAQIQTFVAFIFSLYYQRRYFFELAGNNLTGEAAAKVAEALLERELNYNKFSGILYQFLLNVARFGIGIIKHTWIKEIETVWKKEEIPGVSLLGMNVKKASSRMIKTEAVQFLGNKLYPISPYRWFPDIRVPLTRFQEGEFCGCEDEYTYVWLKQQERNGLVAGVDYIPLMTKTAFEDRGATRFTSFQPLETTGVTRITHGPSTVILTEVQFKMIPSRYKVGGKPVGEEDYPIPYVIWYCNDSRVIRCEPLNYIHNNFTYDVCQFSPDQHQILNEGLADMVSHLQDVANWFINSHIQSVRKSISNQFVADPSAIYLEDFRDRKTVIRLKPNAARSGVDKWIKQLQVSDVTQNHIKDVEVLQGLMQYTTGINDNMLGQYFSGRRSATEARQTNMASSNRLILIAKLIYDIALEPLGRHMLSNLRDGLDLPTYVKIIGDVPEGLEAFNNFVKVDKTQLMGEFDFEVFDGTLANEKNNLASMFQEILVTLMQNPEAAQILNLDVNKIFREMISLRGVKNIDKYDLRPNIPQQLGMNNGIPQSVPSTGPTQVPTPTNPNAGAIERRGIRTQMPTPVPNIATLISGGQGPLT